MLVRDIKVEQDGDSPVLSASVERSTGERFAPRFKFDGVQPEAIVRRGDPFLAAFLPLAMAAQEPLEIDAPVSALLGDSVPSIMAVYRAWWGMSPTAVRTAHIDVERTDGAVGLFFSCGVDSFHSLLKNHDAHSGARNRISHLVTVHGFDVPLADTSLRRSLRESVARVAEATSTKAVTVTTNLRTFADPLVDWGAYHGAALASVGLALGGALGKCLIASTYAYEHVRPWGSHPLLDPMWSTEQTAFVHDGCEARRVQKLERLGRSPVALQTLRVCYKHAAGEYNCGQCTKCLNVMLALLHMGALEHSATFPQRLDLRAVRRMDLSNDAAYITSCDLMTALSHAGEHADVVAAVRRAHSRQSARVILQKNRIGGVALRLRSARRLRRLRRIDGRLASSIG